MISTRKIIRQRKNKFYSLNRQKKRADYIFVGIALLLSLFGLIMIFETSSVTAEQNFSDKYYFLKSQLVWFCIGAFLMFLVSKFDYKKYYNLSIFMLIGTLIALAAVFLPGIGIKASGAHRWMNLGFFQFQPTELAKLVLIIYLSAWFTYKEKERLLPFLILTGLVLGLIVLEPDLGTAVIIGAIAVILYFLSGASIWQFALILPAGIVSIITLGVISPYRYRRLVTFLDPASDPQGASYHIRQLLLALGSGGWFGAGIGKSRQKFYYLPEATTDSIFAIIGEELGFIGTTILLFLFSYLVYNGFKIAQNAPTRFGQILAGGITSWIAVQTIINLAAMVALLPLTGVPLMFLSYGGSSLVVSLVGIGILLNISKQS